MNQVIIINSSGYFSSFVILVKKKNMSWRMCIDYRELNKVIVADKYPIQVVKEILDELYGATYFYKLSLNSDIIKFES